MDDPFKELKKNHVHNAEDTDTTTDTDTDNYCIVSFGVYIVKYISKGWNNQQLKFSYKRPTFTL